MKEYANYESYDFDRLTEGSQIKIEHTVYCKETDMSDLISKPLTELMDLREGSAIAEQAAYENVRQAARVPSQQKWTQNSFKKRNES